MLFMPPACPNVVMPKTLFLPHPLLIMDFWGWGVMSQSAPPLLPYLGPVLELKPIMGNRANRSEISCGFSHCLGHSLYRCRRVLCPKNTQLCSVCTFYMSLLIPAASLELLPIFMHHFLVQALGILSTSHDQIFYPR